MRQLREDHLVAIYLPACAFFVICELSGMIASTGLAVLFVPSFFVVLQRLEERVGEGELGGLIVAHAPEHRADEARFVELGAGKKGAGHARAVEYGLFQKAGAGEVGTVERGLGEIGVVEVVALERTAGQARPPGRSARRERWAARLSWPRSGRGRTS